MKKLKIFSVLILFGLGICVAVRPIYAQTFSLTVSPPIIELTIKPDKSVVIAYTITNTGDPMVLKPYVRPFSPINVYGELAVADEFSGPIRFNLENSNIQLDTPFFLKNGGKQQLLLKIRVPEGTPEGDYYYSFLAENVPGKLAEGTSQPITQGAIGSNILISVTNTGVFESNAHISQFKVDAPYTLSLFGKKISMFESSDTIPVRLIAQNNGKGLIKPEGKITLSGDFGEETSYDILPENILSNSSRLLHATPSAKLLSKEESLIIEGFHMGKYVLRTSMHFGVKNQPVQSSVVFYAFPIKLLAATGFAIIIGIIILKKFNSPENEDEKKEEEN